MRLNVLILSWADSAGGAWYRIEAHQLRGIHQTIIPGFPPVSGMFTLQGDFGVKSQIVGT